MEYLDFLKTKQVKIQKTGFEVHEDELNPALFDFQKYCVKNALAAGKYALFEDGTVYLNFNGNEADIWETETI